jgi:4'-phosphopantetheinyl transferase
MPQVTILHPGRVDVWMTGPVSALDARKHHCDRLLSESECVRLRRYKVQGARDQFLAARVLVRTTLSMYADVAPQEWKFETNRYGRPSIMRPEQFRCLRFNLSHTDGLVVCAIASTDDIGIDVENVQRDLNPLTMAPSVFAPQEVMTVIQAPPKNRKECFFSIWTLKESYIKARGMGLSLPLDAFWFDLGGGLPRIQFTDRCPDDPLRWQFRRYSPTPVHRLAIAASNPMRRELDVHLRWLTLASVAPDGSYQRRPEIERTRGPC